MNDHEDQERVLRRALHDAAAHLPPRETDAASTASVAPGAHRRVRAPRVRRTLAGVLAAMLVVATVVVATALVGDDHQGGDHREAVHRDDTSEVLHALAATVDSGGYDLQFTFHIEPAAEQPLPCTEVGNLDGASSCGAAQVASTDVNGNGTVNTSPYAMTVVTDYLGGITIFVDDSTVWEFGGADYGTDGPSADASGPGSSLSGFAGLVEGTLGRGQGALTMISLASNTGYLGLESEMISRATSDGGGVLDDGTHVTYYRVDVDLTKMVDAPALSSEQRQAIADAIGVLQSIGYSGTDERIGIDDAGFIRDVVAATNFSDGSSMTRHSTFSNFGCATRVSMPGEAAVSTSAGQCPATGTTSTTPPTSTTVPSTTTPPPTTTSEPSPTTTVPVTSSPPPTSTVPEPSTTG